MDSTSKVKCVLCGSPVEEEGQDACIGCRQAAGEDVETPDEPVTGDICPNCGKEAQKMIMGLCTECVGTDKEKPKPEKQDTKVRPMEALAQALEQIAEILKTDKRTTKATVAEMLQLKAKEVRQIQANTMEWVKNQIAKARKTEAVASMTTTKEAPKPQPKEQPKKKAGPKNPDEIFAEVCPKCDGTGLYMEGEGPCWRCKGKGHMTNQDKWDWDGHPANPDRKPLRKARKAEAPTPNEDELGTMLGQALINRLLGK